MRFKNITVCNHCGKQKVFFATPQALSFTKLNTFQREGKSIIAYDVCQDCFDEFLFKAQQLFDDFNSECDFQKAKNEKLLDCALAPVMSTLDNIFEKVGEKND